MDRSTLILQVWSAAILFELNKSSSRVRIILSDIIICGTVSKQNVRYILCGTVS